MSGNAPEIDRSSFLPSSMELWDHYWADPAAATQTPADLMMALVWIESYDDYRRKKAQADLEPIVEGSMGQSVANPLYGVADKALSMALTAARQMGIGAKNRADLGITLLQERVTLDSINARFTDAEDRLDHADDDPR